MKGKVLLQLSDGRLIVYHQGCIIVYNLNESISSIIPIEYSLGKRILCKVRLIERAMHTDAKWAREIEPGKVAFLYNNVVYLADLNTTTVKKEFSGFQGNPFSVLQYGDSLYMGDYGNNTNRKPVNIYKRDNNGNWHICYSFRAGLVRHIHNIVKAETGFYILTGDEDHESGIWFADDDFCIVDRILTGSQYYRSCQMVCEKNNSWYLSDAPSELNYLYAMDQRGERRIAQIEGTCIYGTNWNKIFAFSTTVEPDAHAQNRIEYWLTNKPGKGICSKKTYLMLLHNGEMNQVTNYYHDGKSLRLFQYATIYFAHGCKELLYYTPNAVRKYDNRVFSLHVE